MHLGNALQGKDLAVQESIVTGHVSYHDPQDKVGAPCYGKALKHLRVAADLLLDLRRAVEVVPLQ